jgi:hypothetical protein
MGKTRPEGLGSHYLHFGLKGFLLPYMYTMSRFSLLHGSTFCVPVYFYYLLCLGGVMVTYMIQL